ncbi:trypsin-like peptidase domain-containing protein [Amycolatopsis sp. PS_44_ISF1]|uniref:S1C family serine protease n=1 Tax=Amycolatopsis sp. PS_44_ISF1 TaxID=2974917 RepID=UPI0028DF30E1|nr:trypsin-like peptidase domain-containing protein [Amycolatopsis sp. PS_44_ISF1]MDT8915293.1 S1C family serine protease [Amycolatopsis sp. PS_44_ISF1]
MSWTVAVAGHTTLERDMNEQEPGATGGQWGPQDHRNQAGHPGQEWSAQGAAGLGGQGPGGEAYPGAAPQSGHPYQAGYAGYPGEPQTGAHYAHPGAQYPAYGAYPGTQQFPQTPYHRPQRANRPGRGAAIAVGAVVLAVVAGLGVGHFVWTPRGTSASGNQDFGAPSAPGGTSSTAIDPSAIAGKVDPGLVDVNTELGYQGAAAAGTGIVLTADGEILTNNHVVEGATSIKVTDIGNGRTYTASVLGYDRSHDIAVIKLAGASGLTTEPLGDSNSVQVGDAVVGIGNAGGTGGTPSAAAGKVTALNQSITASDESSSSSEQLTGLIQVDADIQSGDSGGALVNANGQVIGVDTAASAGYRFDGGQGRGGRGRQGQGGLGQGGLGQGQGGLGQGQGGLGQGDGQQGSGQQGSGQQGTGHQGFAIPIAQAVTLAHQIVAGTASDTVHIGQSAFLGVSVSDAGTQGGVGQGGVGQGQGGLGQGQSGQGQGAQVQDVVAGGPAATAGLTAGDVITALDGRAVDSATTLTTLMDTHHPGDRLTVTVTGQSGRHDVTVVPASGPVG